MDEQRQSTPQALPFVTLRNWDRADLAGTVLRLIGRRVILVNAEGSHYDYRAWTELRMSAGAVVLDVVTDTEWWRYRHLAMRPEPLRWPAAAAWVEMD
jgi:hypothetical protein